MNQCCIHYILKNKLLKKHYGRYVPRVGDEIRLGGEGNETFYAVERIVWVYDEPKNPAQRVNIGIVKVK